MTTPVLDGHDGSQGVVERAQRLVGVPHLVLALILAFGCILYFSMLNDWFQTDDFIYLRVAQTHDSPAYQLHAWNFYADRSDGPISGSQGKYQPLYEIGIVSEAKVFGLHALPYHAVSLALHLTNAALVWFVVMKVTKRQLVAHLATLIFVAHPTYVIAVSWISDQVALAATTCALFCVLSFTKSLEPGRNARLWYAASIASYLAAIFFHPKVAVVPVALAAYYFFVYSTDLRGLTSPRSWLRFTPYVAVAFFPLAANYWLRDQSVYWHGANGVGPHIYKNYVQYLRMALIPDPWLHGARLGAVACGAWLSIGLWLLRDPRYRSVGVLALAWLVAAIFPLTTLTSGAYNRELYVAGPAVALTLALFLVSVLDWLPKQAATNMLAFAVVVVLFALVSRRTIMNESAFAGNAAESRDFIERLRETYPALPRGTSVYVVGTPSSLHIFGDVHLNALGQVYYGDIPFITVSEVDAEAIERSGQPNAFVFRYAPP
jgi:hypothetical protein